MEEKEKIISQLKNLRNKLEIEKLMFPSLTNEIMTKEFVEKLISTMELAYNFNIKTLEDVIKEMENK